MKFLYRARNKDGNIQGGTVVAADQSRAEQLLLENGLTIINIQFQPESLWEKLPFFSRGAKNKDMVLFSRQLATLISAGVPLIQSLRILQEQVNSNTLLKVIGGLITGVEGGQSFSLALSQYPNIFGNVYVSLVKSGEVSGGLDKSLSYLADQLEKDYELRSKVKSALTYPTFVIVALAVVGILMFKFVLPKLTSVLEEQGGTLPTASVILIAFTKFFDHWWWAVLLGLALLVLAVRFLLSTPTGRYQWDTLKIHLPIVGDIFRKIYLARFARNLSTLVMGGIPIIQALQIVSEVINNSVYREILLQSISKIQDGKSISESLTGYSEFPAIVTQMVHVGEQSAQLDTILAKLAVFYEKEVDNKIGTLTTLLEPIIMIILGLGVGMLVAGILLPIYNLANTAG